MTTVIEVLDFTDPSIWELDEDDIEIINNNAQLKLDIRVLNYFQNFASTSGFLFNIVKTEFIISEEICRQVDQKPVNALSWATYNNNIDLNYGDGVRTGTGVGSPLPTITTNKLDLTGNIIRYVDYDANQNAQMVQTGTIKFKITPDYQYTPPNNRTIFCLCEQPGSNKNLIQLTHLATLNRVLRFELYDFQGSLIISDTFTGWPGISTDEIEIQINFDLNAGIVRYFRNGTRVKTNTISGVRDSNTGLLRIGSDYTGVSKADFFINDFIVYSAVENTSTYIPGYTLADYRYLEDLITLPTFNTIGNAQSYLSFATVQSTGVKFNIDGKYFNTITSTWDVSDDSPSQMNDPIDISANIEFLNITTQIQVKMRTVNGEVQQSIDTLLIEYDSVSYPISVPDTLLKDGLFATEILSFLASLVQSGNDTITFTLVIASIEIYWNGIAWVDSIGYPQTNTVQEINDNLSELLLTGGEPIKPRIYLYSENGKTTPVISSVTIEYDEVEVVVNECLVFGTVIHPGYNPAEGVTVTAELSEYALYDNAKATKKIASTVTNSFGYWELELAENESMHPLTGYIFRFEGEGISDRANKRVPNKQKAPFATLEEL